MKITKDDILIMICGSITLTIIVISCWLANIGMELGDKIK